jgi:ATP-dependent DNA helicase DinG
LRLARPDTAKGDIDLDDFKGLMKNLKPCDLNLPAQFTEFRPEQTRILEKIAPVEKKIICVQAPPGLGKTTIAVAYARLQAASRAVYATHQKNLQAQVVSDFSSDLTGKEFAVELKGRDNYRCLKNPALSCNECTKTMGNKWAKHCARCEYKRCVVRNDGGPLRSISECLCAQECPYGQAKDKASHAELAILNMAYFLAEANAPCSKFSELPLVILDEADQTENALLNHIAIEIPLQMLNRLGLAPPPMTNPIRIDETGRWVATVLNALQSRITELARYKEPTIPDIRDRVTLERLMQKLNEFCGEDLDEWVVIPPNKTQLQVVTWKPVNVRKHAEKYLWRHSNSFLLLSGTILNWNRMAQDLGLKENETKFVEAESDFPPGNRPIYYIPTVNMTDKSLKSTGLEETWGAMARKTDEIIKNNQDVKGLIQTPSYDFARYFYGRSLNRERLIMHNNSAEREHCIETLKKSPLPLVMVSPSLSRGFDGKDDLCRFIIVTKVPYPNPTDPQIARRLREPGGQVWFEHNVIRTIIQETSRGNRHKNDFCRIYILDEQFGKLFYGYQDQTGHWHSGYSGIFPKWWKVALKFENHGQTATKEKRCNPILLV